MKILITGGSGFIGTHVANRLLTGGHALLNLSTHPPHESALRGFWQKTDILDCTNRPRRIRNVFPGNRHPPRGKDRDG